MSLNREPNRLPQNEHEQLAALVAERTRELEQELADLKVEAAALRASEEKYRGLFESSRDAIMTLEPPIWRFTSGNPAAVKLFGAKTEEEFISHRPWDLSPERQPDGRPSVDDLMNMIQTAMREGSHFFEWTHRRLDGEDFPATVLLSRIELPGKMFLQVTVREIPEQKRLEAPCLRSQRLEDIGARAGGMAHDLNFNLTIILCSAQFLRDKVSDTESRAMLDDIETHARRGGNFIKELRTIFKSVDHRQLSIKAGKVGLWEWDLITNQVYYSPEWKSLIGYEEQEIGNDLSEWQSRLYPFERERVLQAFQTLKEKPGPDYQMQFRLRHKNGSYRDILAQGSVEFNQQGKPVRILGSQVDISSINSSWQRLTRGNAHNFNNSLAIIRMGLRMLEDHPSLDAEAKPILQDLVQVAEQVTGWNQQLLRFDRGDQSSILDLNQLLANQLTMLGQLVGEHINIRFDRNDSVPPVEADPSSLEKVLMELVTNARDAIPNGGMITISIELIQVDAERVKGKPGAQPGPFVCLSVADTGCGMDETTRQRIFEPFFTTKGGEGLGLATICNLIACQKGWVEVESELGQGTTFKVFLPAIQPH